VSEVAQVACLIKLFEATSYFPSIILIAPRNARNEIPRRALATPRARARARLCTDPQRMQRGGARRERVPRSH